MLHSRNCCSSGGNSHAILSKLKLKPFIIFCPYHNKHCILNDFASTLLVIWSFLQLKYTESHKSFLMHAENKCPKWMAKFWGEIYLMNLCPHYILNELNPLYFHLNKYIQKSRQIFSFAVGLLSIQKQMWILWIDLLITPWAISSDFTYAFCSTTLRGIKNIKPTQMCWPNFRSMPSWQQ